jgi:GNAT superfamily N-acetyltransferase
MHDVPVAQLEQQWSRVPRPKKGRVFTITMPHIRFNIHMDCGDPEPSRCTLHLDGEIFEFEDGEADADLQEIKIGKILATVLLRSRAMNEHESVLDVMDSIDDEHMECYEELFDEHGEWKEAVESLYGSITEHDVLFIRLVELDAAHRGKGVGAEVVRETIARFGSNCGLVTCKPFPLQYSHWNDDAHKAMREEPGFEKKRLAEFGRVENFWRKLGFNKLQGSDFFTYAPEFLQQPSGINMLPPVPNRVPRGRRRVTGRRQRRFD